MSTLIVIVFGIRADVHMLSSVRNAKVHFSASDQRGDFATCESSLKFIFKWR